jgi:hypothetical protein
MLQGVPSGSGGSEHTPEVGSHEPAAWHSSSGVQTVAVPPQLPDVHVSPLVQASPSSQKVPSPTGCASQLSLVSLQTPSLQASLEPEQSTAVPALHTPDWHVSAPLQYVPSSQGVPLLAGCASQLSLVSLQTPVTHVPSRPEQSTAVPALHTPDWHVSAPLQ